ncbi:hypothetical protein O0L34_g6022 [Tuta absoluta]|nr:hypothetical protein O0L34_g6022 [Tuta absoluta]
MRGLSSLHRVPSDMVAEMLELQQLDLRSNGLRHMEARLLRAPANLQQVYLGGKILDVFTADCVSLTVYDNKQDVSRRTRVARINLAIRRGNAARMLGTIYSRDASGGLT